MSVLGCVSAVLHAGGGQCQGRFGAAVSRPFSGPQGLAMILLSPNDGGLTLYALARCTLQRECRVNTPDYV